MIKMLNDLALLKEVEHIDGLRFSTNAFREKYSAHIIVVNRVSFIKKEFLSTEIQKRVTCLNDCVLVSDLARRISISAQSLKSRIILMKRNPYIYLFEFKEIKEVYFIRLTPEFQYLMHYTQPFVATYKELSKPKTMFKMLGDLRIGFY